MNNKIQRFSIIKLAVGAASVAIGMTFVGAHQALADTTSSETVVKQENDAQNANNSTPQKESNADKLDLTETHTDKAPNKYLPNSWKDGYEPIHYQNKDAVDIKPYDDPSYPAIRGEKGWTAFAWYAHANKEHGKG